MNREKYRTYLLEWGCQQLHEEGQEYATVDTILTTPNYAYRFRDLLPEKQGISMKMDEEIERLLEELPEN